MKKLTLLLMLALSFSQSALSLQYSKADSLKVVRLFLQADSQKFNNIQERTLFFARKLIGIPYVASTLEVNRKEHLVVNLRQLDCTTFVENSLALALTHQSGKKTFREFCKKLQTLRYRGGKDVSYIGRLHYFTEWIEDNTRLGICKEIQSPNPPFTMIQHVRVDYMSRHSDKYPMLFNNSFNRAGISKMEKAISGKSYRYIPKSQVKNTRLLRSTIKNGDIIAIITNKSGLDTQHIGFAVWHKDGLHLLNASSIHHKVVEEPMLLSAYLAKRKTMPGIRIIRLKN